MYNSTGTSQSHQLINSSSAKRGGASDMQEWMVVHRRCKNPYFETNEKKSRELNREKRKKKFLNF